MEASFKMDQIVIKITASVIKTKHNRDMVHDSIILCTLVDLINLH